MEKTMNRLPDCVPYAQLDAQGFFDGHKDCCDVCGDELKSGSRYLELRDEKICESCIASKWEVY